MCAPQDVFSGPGNAACPDDAHPNNMCDVEIGKRDWMTTFQPAFRGAIIEGKARSVMCSVSVYLWHCHFGSLWGTLECLHPRSV